MNQSYKIALIIAAALCVVALVYYVRQDNQAADPPTVILAPADPPANPQADETPALPSPSRPDHPGQPEPPPAPPAPPVNPQPQPQVPTWTFDGQSSIQVDLDDPQPPLDDPLPAQEAQEAGDEDQDPSMDEPGPNHQAAAIDDPTPPGPPDPAAAPGPAASPATSTSASSPAGTESETADQPPFAAAPTTPAATPSPSQTPAADASPDDDSAAFARTYTIQSGDTFSAIAVRLYGDEAHWVRIAQANPTVDPARLRVGTQIRLPAPDQPAPQDAPPGPEQVQRYVVQSGDSLIAIARQFYGDGSLWRVIYNHNRQVIGSDENRLQEGMRLSIPPRP